MSEHVNGLLSQYIDPEQDDRISSHNESRRQRTQAIRGGRGWGIVGFLLLAWACSEEPNQSIENSRNGITDSGREMLDRNSAVEDRDNQAMAELIMALKETKMALKESEVLLRDAPRGEESRASLVALEKELKAAERRLMDVGIIIEKGEYLKAKAHIHEITDRTNQVNQQIKREIQKQDGHR